jgi:hypothetical protein
MGNYQAQNIRYEWRFRIGDVLPADNPLARFIVAVAAMLNDTILSNSMFVRAQRPYERSYFFSLSTSHLYEAAETFYRAQRDWAEVRNFVAGLDAERYEEFERVAALARPDAGWPGSRLKEIRNSFFHYVRLDRAAAQAGRLSLADGMAAAEDVEGLLVIEPGGPLSGIRAGFADDIGVSALTASMEDGELERLAAELADYVGALSRFSQAAVGRYLYDQPQGVVRHEAIPVDPEADADHG